MSANPNPGDAIIPSEAERSVSVINTYRPQFGIAIIELLGVEAGMRGRDPAGITDRLHRFSVVSQKAKPHSVYETAAFGRISSKRVSLDLFQFAALLRFAQLGAELVMERAGTWALCQRLPLALLQFFFDDCGQGFLVRVRELFRSVNYCLEPRVHPCTPPIKYRRCRRTL